MSGDDPAASDHPDAKAVFNLEAIGLLKTVQSLNQDRDLGGNVPGINVPDAIMEALRDAEDVVMTSFEIAARTIGALDGVCAGVNFMALGWERHIPRVLDMAGLSR